MKTTQNREVIFHKAVTNATLLALALKRERGVDVFVSYQPHVDWCEMRAFFPRWTSGREPTFFACITERGGHPFGYSSVRELTWPDAMRVLTRYRAAELDDDAVEAHVTAKTRRRLGEPNPKLLLPSESDKATEEHDGAALEAMLDADVRTTGVKEGG